MFNGDLTELPFNLLHRVGTLVRATLALEDPLADRRYISICEQPHSLGRDKEYRYLYTANSVVFDCLYHLTAIASHQLMHAAVHMGLCALLDLLLKL